MSARLDDGSRTVLDLSDIKTEIDFNYVKTRLTPPPRFVSATLDNYTPDEQFASQQAAKAYLKEFVGRFNKQSASPLGTLFRFVGTGAAKGIYLDGGFGVGKTHLLAASYHAFQSSAKIYLSFTELMYLIGLLGLERCAGEMSRNKLICIDEFELDDPGNTTMSLGFLQRVFAAHVRVIATSNTPPAKLGEGRFAAQNFQREIAALSEDFHVLRIDGNDYREKNIKEIQTASSTWNFPDVYEEFLNYQPKGSGKKVYFSELELLALLKKLHPMHYLDIAEKLDAIFIDGLGQLADQFDALRFVYFIDKLYDDKVVIFASSKVKIESLFPDEFYKSAYSKKYLRCLSRLKEICGA